ncbi:MAG TPA: type II toxin-antitoxin system VapC family toxin [Terriglobales bacterium]|nr:type II toxin-antitoxin system VapC family toxin [Terriglobales bacterium]
MRVLLDTAALIFAVEAPERLSKRAANVLKNPNNIRELSSISLAEIAVKASLGKLGLSTATLNQAIDDLDLRVLRFSAEHAFKMFELPMHHRDPFDLQLIAQALCEDIAIVTPDRKFSLYRGLKIIW